jgi:hypothetical protein
MKLERVIELDVPFTDLAVSLRPVDDLLLKAGPVTVHANTGALYEGDPSITYQRGFHGVRRLTVNSVTAEAVGGTITLSNGLSINAHSSPINTLGLCASGSDVLLVSASEGGNIRLWDIHTGDQRGIAVQQSPVTSLVSYLGPEGRPRIAAGGPEGALHIWDTQLRAVGPRTWALVTRGFNDRVANQDLLDRQSLVSALAEVLEPGDGPTVITLEGAWGSGKSTVLEFVRIRLTRSPDDHRRGRKLTVVAADRMLYRPPTSVRLPKGQDKPLVAFFNPWQHQSSEQVWAGLATAVTAAAEPAIIPDQNSKERYWFAKNVHRVDRRHLQRQLWKRIYSPLLSFAGLGFALSLLGALTKLDLRWAWWATAGLAGVGLLHTARRYFFGRASAFLPGELFAGPIASTAFSAPGTDPAIRDPYYQAKSGYLYLVQHDVKALLEDLADHGYQVVLLIDDLDRCTPRTTAQVFEAINVFLSKDFPATRFVLGLDSSVVASHVDHAYKELADAEVVAHPDDPSPGWTFLRKLVQLPVRLPRTTEDTVDGVLTAHLGEIHEEDDEEPALFEGTKRIFDGYVEAVRAEQAERVVVALEQHAEVRTHLRRRLTAQPDHSVREQKRLLNVWQFYLRVLRSADVALACHLVVVAEIAVRWPAYLHRLRGSWQDLADAVDDDVRWGATIAKLGFTYSDRKAAANLRALLRDCDAQAVAGLANRLF